MKAADFMAQAVGKMRGPTRIVIRSVKQGPARAWPPWSSTTARTRSTSKTFRFDASGNLLDSDLFALTRG